MSRAISVPTEYFCRVAPARPEGATTPTPSSILLRQSGKIVPLLIDSNVAYKIDEKGAAAPPPALPLVTRWSRGVTAHLHDRVLAHL